MAEPYVQLNNSGDTVSGSLLRGRGRAVSGRIALIAVLSAFPAVLFYAYLHYSETGSFPALPGNTDGFMASVAAGIVVGGILYTCNKMLDRWMPWTKYFSTRLLVGLVSNLLVAMLVAIPVASAVIKVGGATGSNTGITPADPDLTWKVIILLVVFVFIYNVIYALLYAYQHYAHTQIEHLRSERRQLELQFEALKSQISPHYLFNSLNTISSLLFKDLQSAEQFIRRLVETYQYILATRNKKFVLLSEEVEFVKSYYYLLRIRFQEQLHVEFNVPSGIMNTRIPPLTLQMLVENAVKHNRLSGDNRLFIYISAQDNTYVNVMNTRTDLTGHVDSFQIGLENIRQRYRHFTDRKILVRSDERFVVSLPVIYPKHNKTERKYSA